MSRRLEAKTADRLRSAIPFGLGQTKPGHFRDMLRIAWQNRDNPSYAWKVLSQGVCDGCALGVAGRVSLLACSPACPIRTWAWPTPRNCWQKRRR
jgi:hypothetical protein